MLQHTDCFDIDIIYLPLTHGYVFCESIFVQSDYFNLENIKLCILNAAFVRIFIFLWKTADGVVVFVQKLPTATLLIENCIQMVIR